MLLLPFHTFAFGLNFNFNLSDYSECVLHSIESVIDLNYSLSPLYVYLFIDFHLSPSLLYVYYISLL